MTEAQDRPLPTPDTRMFDKQVIASESARIGINPKGGYISSWQVKNPQGAFEDILYIGKTQKRTGIPTLFPYYGEADEEHTGMRTHGFGRDSTWQVSTEGNKAIMYLTSDAIDENAKREYPYPFKTFVTIEAQEDGSLEYTMHVDNTGTDNLPISPGLHPYWAIPHGDKQTLRAAGIEGFDPSAIDWTHNPPDTPFSYKGRVTVKMPDRQITIEDITEGGPVIKHAVVWSQTPDKDDYDFVCIEPITGKDNAINEDPILVSPGNSWEMKLRFSSSFH